MVGIMERRDFLHTASSVGLVTALAPLFGIADARAGSGTADLIKGLQEDDLIYVSTRRKNGSWSSQAPIWF